jgi:hypothetical protein
MSSNAKQIKQQTQTPWCKVCYDAGKPAKEYTSHYVRDAPGGTVICPTLLNQTCNYCKIAGHVPSCCPELKGKYQKNYKTSQPLAPAPARRAPAPTRPAPTPRPNPNPAPKKPAPVPAKIKKNFLSTLATLMEEDEQKYKQDEQQYKQEEERKQRLNENFPTMSRNKNTTDTTILRSLSSNSPNKNSWSQIAAGTGKPNPPAAAAIVEQAAAAAEEAKEEQAPTATARAPQPQEEEAKAAAYTYVPSTSWSDME